MYLHIIVLTVELFSLPRNKQSQTACQIVEVVTQSAWRNGAPNISGFKKGMEPLRQGQRHREMVEGMAGGIVLKKER